jgi:PAS domain S-box-containing protein
MDRSGSAPDGVLEEVRSRFEGGDDPAAPLTAAEVAADVGCPTAAAREGLAELADRDVLHSRDLEGGPRVWWRPADAEAAAESDRAEYEAFVSAVRDYAIFTLDPDGVVVTWNEGARRIKGYEESEIVGQHFSRFYTEEEVDDDVPAGNLEKATAAGRVEDEGWRVRADGSRFWANVTITAVRDDDGELRGFTKVTRDMTEQREYELELRRERDLTNQILETVPISITVVDEDGEFVRANRRMLGRMDVAASAFEGSSAADWTLYDADDEPIPLEEWPWKRVLETGEPVYDFRCQADLPAEGRRWLSVNAAPLEADDQDGDLVVVSIEDITEQRRRQRQLERRKADLETELSEILARISDAFYALDEEWRFTHLNEQAAELMRQPREELLAGRIWEVLPGTEASAYRERFETAMDAQEPVDFEEYVDDIDAWLEFNVYPSETGVSVYMHDITERKEYQRKLEESNERLEQFAYAASHDLQEPLRMVSSYLQLLEKRYADDLDEDAGEFIEFAVEGADRMREMIEALLAYSRVETQGEPLEPVDLGTVLEEAHENLLLQIQESGAEVTAGDLPTVSGDENQLRQVFQNLLDNAIEYSGEGPPRVHVDAERAGDRWVVSVADDGIGIDPGEADRVFEVFHRLHSREEHEGTGIGLALCERIVERHGGDIWVESEGRSGASPSNSGGTTVSFTLPAADGPAGDGTQ